MPFTLPPLPFDKAALEPHMSAKTLDFHHGKHHRKYVEKLNALTEGTKFAKMDLTEIVRETAGATDKKKIDGDGWKRHDHAGKRCQNTERDYELFDHDRTHKS